MPTSQGPGPEAKPGADVHNVYATAYARILLIRPGSFAKLGAPK